MPSYQQYRISRTLPNGWKIRLDFVPYDVALGATLNNPIAEMDEVVLLELGEQTAEFDAVPYGLCKPQTLKFKLAWSRLPSVVQNALETGYDGNRTNLWLLYSDRGTGSTYTLEFAGCEDNIESLELEPLDGGDYAYNVELVDICYHAMKTTTGQDVLGGKQGAGTIPNNIPWQFFLEKSRGRNQKHIAYGPVRIDHTRDALVKVLDGLGGKIVDNFSHEGVSSLVQYQGIADATSTLRDIFVAALELYGCGTNEPDSNPRRTRKTPDYSVNTGTGSDTDRALLATEIYLTTNVGIGSAENTGGLYSASDNYAWGRKDVAVYDLVRDLCETLGVKASYKFNYVVKTGTEVADRITVTWYVKRIAASRNYANDVDTTDISLDLDTALASPKITKRGDNILKSEVRYETSNQEDKTEIVRITKGARASRSMNVEPIVHNIPVFLKDFDEQQGRYEGFKQTNQLFFKGRGVGARLDGTVVKVHEDTKYWYGPKSTQYISVTSTASNNPEQQKDETQQATGVQLAALQAETSMATALTKLHLKAFSDNDNAIAETEWDYRTSPLVMCEGLAGRHTLTGDVTSTFSALAWDYALPSSISVDWVGGVSKVKYYLFSPTTAN